MLLISFIIITNKMNENIKISYIIPCYNAEKYISRCLDSIYNQEISESDFEIICINDCSPDNMRDIILEYQKQHNNLKLIEHTENKRQGGARNTGLRNAKGKYVWFIDNDDCIKENCVCELLSICFENDLDLLQFNYCSQGKNSLFLEEDTTVTGFSYLKKWLNTGESVKYSYMFSIWTRLLKRELLINNNIFFREQQPVLENVAHSYKTFCFSKRVQAVDRTNYFFGENPDSSSRTRLNAHKLFNGRFGIANELLNLSDQIKSQEPYIADALLRWDAAYHLSLIKIQFSRQTVSEQLKFVKLVKRHKSFVKSVMSRIDSILPVSDKLTLKFPLLLFIYSYFFRVLRNFKKVLS